MRSNPFSPENWGHLSDDGKAFMTGVRTIYLSEFTDEELELAVILLQAEGDVERGEPPDLLGLTEYLSSGRVMALEARKIVAKLLRGGGAYTIRPKRARGRPKKKRSSIDALQLDQLGLEEREGWAIQAAIEDRELGAIIWLFESNLPLTVELCKFAASILMGKAGFEVRPTRRKGKHRTFDHMRFTDDVLNLVETGESLDAAVDTVTVAYNIEKRHGYDIFYRNVDDALTFRKHLFGIANHYQETGTPKRLFDHFGGPEGTRANWSAARKNRPI
jgi:hypothetical protein